MEELYYQIIFMKKTLVIGSIVTAMLVAMIIVKLMVAYIDYANSIHSTFIIGN